MASEIKVLCIGDVVGRPGRTLLSRAVPLLREAYDFELVIVNAENAAGGTGLTPQIFEKLIRYGVDVVTLGDHCYRRNDIIPILTNDGRAIRPANLPPDAAGRGFTTVTTHNGLTIGVAALLGRLYMKPVDCPFRVIDEVVGRLKRETNIIFVDIHAEATSEKVALGWHLDGKVSCVFGTHTHVPTADCTVLPGGTAYITDLGMTGPYDSVLGRDKQRVIRSLITGMPNVYNIAEGNLKVGGLMVTVDKTTGRALSAEQLLLDESDLDEIEAEVDALHAVSENDADR